ncbi:NPHN-like protein [Mya arenaria]|uniref:NPHN-like protein n=1 Tax=Mya arenaria TaxID=6604 RepID=A0ABY7FZB1_MYAAR|nr:NPHN-like protein [Mya arenaria]
MFIVKDGKTILKRPVVHQLIHRMTAECSDTGVYTCSGYNHYGTADNASLRSARQPPRVDVKLNYNAREHDNVTLSYTIVAFPVPEPSQFAWERCTNESKGSCNNSLDGMHKFDVMTKGLSSFLTIRDVKIEDYGMYKFSVFNGIGSRLIEWLHLKPIEKPDPPTDFHVIQEEISERSAVLTWVPGFDNGSPQTFYITYAKKGDSSELITQSIEFKCQKEMNYTLRNLESKTEYIASIYASNGEGFSPTINETFITLKHIPGKKADSPVAFIVGSVGGGIATVLVIIGVIFIVKRLRTSGNSRHRYKLKKGQMNQYSSQQQDDDAYQNGQSVSGTNSTGCIAAQTYEELSKTTDTSFYDALNSSSCKAAQTYVESSMKTDTSVYDALS